jgi:hypothetical protein
MSVGSPNLGGKMVRPMGKAQSPHGASREIAALANERAKQGYLNEYVDELRKISTRLERDAQNARHAMQRGPQR